MLTILTKHQVETPCGQCYTGLILAPYMADYGGRKWTIFIGCLVVVIAGVVQCLSINIRMFTAARFLSKSTKGV